jgi:phenylacetate-CoA ligase
MAEAVANFSECDHGALHVDEDFAAVEFIPTADGTTCTVVGTNFTNPAMPLLRYEMGDTVGSKPGTCQCGRPGRVVTTVDGRVEDYIILRSGARVGRLDHALKDLVNIREAQIRQSRRGSILVRVVPGARYAKADEELLVSELRSRVGNDTEIVVEYVQAIERTRGGKLRFVVSDLVEGQLTSPTVR